MKKVAIAVTSSMLWATVFASAAVATEVGYQNSLVSPQDLSLHLETEHAFRASTAAEMEDLQLVFVRKKTQRDDRKMGDE